MKRDSDFSDVKPGDSVYTEGREGQITIYCVEKVTATQFTTNGDRRFRKEDGFLIGSNALGGWHRTYAYRVTPEVRQRLHRQNYLAKLRGQLDATLARMKRYTTEEVVRIYDALAEVNKRVDADLQVEKNRAHT